ncbi:hypothetical protein [Pseudooceanicola atlanticus]|uniref:Lipoprotein n=1 Tax=Pseudooceanicola atlanticus TaxID=1461694 RepID=A0A0A0EBW2_9RHOB|nr:hypothetical protein [Pseudooceanicola atlanticus]KGM48381.1 hypothetical protein ATO9_12090 [Pseudooceanicola atlanticus]
MTARAIICGMVAALSLSACAQFPELDRAIPADEQRGPYPDLVPVGGLLAQAENPRIEDDDADNLSARAAALKARAARLRAY